MIDGSRRGRPAFLASVTSAAEARLALDGGADLIDGKDPARGALGALPSSALEAIVAEVAGRAPVSATVGDLPAEPAVLVAAAEATAERGVDYVKVGFFGGAETVPAVAALGRADLGRARLVAVLMADRSPDLAIVRRLADAGFAGVMLDTADKNGRSLRDAMSPARLSTFLAQARGAGLFAGLAGSLRHGDVAPLVALMPDVLGFRGALCQSGRIGALDAARVAEVRRAIDAAADVRQSVA